VLDFNGHTLSSGSTVTEGAFINPPSDYSCSSAECDVYKFADNTYKVVKKGSVAPAHSQGMNTWTLKDGVYVESYAGGSYYPPAPTTQKPVIEAAGNTTVTLSDYGTKATIKVSDGYELVDVTVNGVSKGKVDTLTGLKTGDKVVVTTKKIVTVEDEISAVKAAKLVARSANAKAPSGKKAIKVYWFNKDGSELNFDGYEIYRSVKKNKFGKKPIFTSKKTAYFNTSVKKGTRYYYKVRGFKVIDGETYYTDFSLKAIRTAK